MFILLYFNSIIYPFPSCFSSLDEIEVYVVVDSFAKTIFTFLYQTIYSNLLNQNPMTIYFSSFFDFMHQGKHFILRIFFQSLTAYITARSKSQNSCSPIRDFLATFTATELTQNVIFCTYVSVSLCHLWLLGCSLQISWRLLWSSSILLGQSLPSFA